MRSAAAPAAGRLDKSASFHNIFAETLAPAQTKPEQTAPRKEPPRAAPTQQDAKKPAAAKSDSADGVVASERKPAAAPSKPRAGNQRDAEPSRPEQRDVKQPDAVQPAGAQPADQTPAAPVPVLIAAPINVASDARPAPQNSALPDPAAIPLNAPLPAENISLPPANATPPQGLADAAFNLLIAPSCGGVSPANPQTSKSATGLSANPAPGAGAGIGGKAAVAPPAASENPNAPAVEPVTPLSNDLLTPAVATGSGGKARPAAVAAAGALNPSAGNTIPWAAPTSASGALAAGGNASAPLATPATDVPAADLAEAAAAPLMRTVHVQLAGEGDQRVDMRLVEYAGGLSVSVRASDNTLTRGLQDHLPELSARLAAEHYQAQAWLPEASAASAGGSAGGSSEDNSERRGGQAFSQGGSSSSGGERNPQQGRKQDQPEGAWEQAAARVPNFSAALSPNTPTTK